MCFHGCLILGHLTHPEAECDTEMPSQYRRLRFHIWWNCETFIHVPVKNTFVGIPLNTPFLLPLTPFQLYQCQGALFGVTHEEARKILKILTQNLA